MPVYPDALMTAWALGKVRCGNQETLVGLCGRVLTWWAKMLLFGFLVLPALVNNHLLLVEWTFL